MKKRHNPRNFLRLLVLWLCLASLIALPISNGISTSALRFLEIDLEDYDISDEMDPDDDFVIFPIRAVEITGLGPSKPRTINWDFPSAFLPPDSPPPKQS
jgi:hypothetical protein